MFYTLDRFEENFAVLLDDNNNVISVLKDVLGENIDIGSVYLSEDGESFCFCLKETEKRRNRAVSLHKSLFNKAKKNK
ncbi:MAG: DUF3006 domain-containing protein [Oscillospiraceae bacterium]|nr:DUF3006 domain-containing protein [Oscillospiraceae bacterium]